MRDSNEASGPGPAPAQEGRLQGRHVLAIALTFFGVVFAVNGVFLFAALSTHTGVVANEPYRKGLAYNARIAAADRQDHLGWSDAVSMSADGTVSLALADKAGAAIEGLQVQATIGRPSTGRYDRTVALVEGPAGH